MEIKRLIIRGLLVNIELTKKAVVVVFNSTIKTLVPVLSRAVGAVAAFVDVHSFGFLFSHLHGIVGTVDNNVVIIISSRVDNVGVFVIWWGVGGGPIVLEWGGDS